VPRGATRGIEQTHSPHVRRHLIGAVAGHCAG
jgi:hypothetical protein